ncbi:MAG: TraB/GumN family protein, partial [Pseudomonadales bacterium]|nr:TraB/GumN family protein [Pseudomonadales bacterium]
MQTMRPFFTFRGLVTGPYWLVALSLLLAGLSALTYAQPHVSIAVHTGKPDLVFSSGEQINRVQAAQAALANCRNAMAYLPELESTGVCEVARMDAIVVTPATELLPRAPTPLFLWRFEHDEATVYLGGTIHVLKESLYPLPQPYLDAYAATQKLVFEVDLSRYPPAQVQQQTMAYATLPEQSLRQSLPSDTYSQLVSAGLIYGLPVGQMQAFKPMLAFQQLGLLGFIAMGYDPEFGIDHYFGQLGEREAEDILQLETLDLQLNLLFNQPLDVQIAVLEQALADLDDIEQSTSALVSAYFNGDDARLLSLIEEQAGEHPLTRAFNAQLLDQRNRAMAKTIQAYL